MPASEPNRRYDRLMGLKDIVTGWMRQGRPDDKKLEQAEGDMAEREYAEEKTDAALASRLGTAGDHFDADESAPR